MIANRSRSTPESHSSPLTQEPARSHPDIQFATVVAPRSDLRRASETVSTVRPPTCEGNTL